MSPVPHTPTPEPSPTLEIVKLKSDARLLFSTSPTSLVLAPDGKEIARLDLATGVIHCKIAHCIREIGDFLRAVDYYQRVQWCQGPDAPK
jgi:hypothetical protein